MINAVTLVLKGVMLVVGCMLCAVGGLLFVANFRDVGMKKSKKRQMKVKSHHQCDTCGTAYCRFEQQAECARLELTALVDGRQHDCPDRVADYWERLNAA